MPPTLELTQDDKYGLEPANVPAAGGVTDDKYGLEPAAKPTEEQIKALPGATPRLLASPAAAGAERSATEKNVTGEGISLKGAGTAAWEKLKQLVPEDPTGGASPLESKFWIGDKPPSFDPAHGGLAEAGHEAKAGYERGMEDLRRGQAHPLAPIGEAISSGLGSLVGVSGEREAEQAKHGEGGQIIGEAAVPAGLAAVSPLVEPIAGGVGRMAGAFREGVGGAIHDPVTGIMTKGTEGLSRGAGTVVGGATGAGVGSIFGPRGTYTGGAIGATAGGLAGPALMERMFPEPTSRIGARETFAKTKELTEAQEAATKENTARQNAARVESERLQKAADKAKQDAEDARNQHAEDLMRRQREQDKLDDEANRAAREAKAARDKPLEQEAQARMRRQKEQDALDKAATKAADDAQAARDQHAEDLIRRQKEQDGLDANHAKALKDLEDARQKELAANEKFIEQHAAALNRRGGVEKMTPPTETGTPKGNTTPFGGPQDLITRTKKLVIPGEKPTPEDLKRAGDMTQTPLPTLKILAKNGDELAKNEINRRLRNEPDFSKMPLPRGNAPQTVTPITPPRIPIEEKVKPLTGYKPSEKVSTMSAPTKNLGPEFEQGEVAHEIARNKEILRNPKATAEDKTIAQARLKELSQPRT
jgi:flagellar biosynthesis GTPase FlhF